MNELTYKNEFPNSSGEWFVNIWFVHGQDSRRCLYLSVCHGCSRDQPFRDPKWLSRSRRAFPYFNQRAFHALCIVILSVNRTDNSCARNRIWHSSFILSSVEWFFDLEGINWLFFNFSNLQECDNKTLLGSWKRNSKLTYIQTEEIPFSSLFGHAKDSVALS